MKLKSAATFTRRLGIGLRAGADLIPLLNAEANHGPQKQRSAMRMLVEGASKGEQLSTIMKRNHKFFPSLMIAMTRVGEETGRIERTLLNLADYYDQQLKLRREFTKSIAWPTLQLIGGILAISLLIWLMGIITTAAGPMTDILGFGLRGTSGVLWFWFYIACFFGVVFAVIWGYKKNIAGCHNIIPLFYMIPVLGSSIQTITLSRFAWTMALSLDAGLDPIRSIGHGLDSTDSEYYRAGADDSKKAILSGATLAGGLNATDVFPDEFISRVEIAELSGTDAESMEGLAKEYDERASLAMKTIAAIATGVVWISVGGFLIYMIFRMVVNIFQPYNDMLKELTP